MVAIAEIQKFFFEAMLQGWAGGAAKTEMPGMPDFKKIEYEHDGFKLLDCYSKSLGSRFSGGWTVIWFEGIPVWMMSYSGQYDPVAIPLLKEALKASYEHRRFEGGRGPVNFSRNGLTYSNQTGNWKFEQFDGREAIHRIDDGRYLGHHQYSGHILIGTR
ncbi:hypothetical protein KW785_03660 [Candidatus Parcubacteria bacterium]|nr:hypothetical protein [Candidatus Parcubacteria bacterium]